jgi:hypothetical protein
MNMPDLHTSAGRAKSLCRICANAVYSALEFCMITSPVTGPVTPAAFNSEAALSRSNG